MKRVAEHRLISLLMVLLLTIPTLGFANHLGELLKSLPSAAPVSASDVVETSWEGGGPLRLFVDDMTLDVPPGVHVPPFPLTSYYGGATPTSEEDAARWKHDLYRWGQSRVAGLPKAESWHISPGSWRFGNARGDSYQGGVLAELASPVVDLRSIPKTQRPPDEVEVNLASSNRKYATDSYASAALRLRHAYQFQTVSGELNDGGRVEVSYYDPGRGEWMPWTGLKPTDRLLRIGDGELRGRTQVPDQGDGAPTQFETNASPSGASPRVRLDLEVPEDPAFQTLQSTPLSDITVAPRVIVDGEDSGLVRSSVPSVPPHLYQGDITSSSIHDVRGKWKGFGGASGDWNAGEVPWAESVFDLTPFAGFLLRLRFLVSTAYPDPDLPTDQNPGRGWILDRLEVHAAGQPGLDIVGLASPGEGVLLPPGTDVHPVVVLQNSGREPLDVQVSFSINQASRLSSIRIGAGELGRGFVFSPSSFQELGPGVHWLQVQATFQQHLEAKSADGYQRLPLTVGRSFHFMITADAGWKPLSLTFHPLNEGTETSSTFLHRHQPARVKLTLLNTGTLPQALELSGNSPDIRPVLWDPSRNSVGTLTPEQALVELPVSRETAGTLGASNAARSVSWMWSGSNSAQVLTLALLGSDGQILANGGTVLVDATRPPALDLNFQNPWRWDCERLKEKDGAHGVLRCQEAQKVISSAPFVLPIDLRHGGELQLQLTYSGRPVRAIFERNATSELGNAPPPNAHWQALGQATMPEASGWSTVRTSLGVLPQTWFGWLRVQLEPTGPGEFYLDEVFLQLRLVNPTTGQEGYRILTSASFDTLVYPEATDEIRSSTNTGLLVLNGRDGWPNLTRLPSPPSSLPAPVADLWKKGENGNYTATGSGATVGVDKGDAQLAVSNQKASLPLGHQLEDAVLQLPQPIDLRRVARPILEFRHWYDLGPRGVAVVEAAQAPTDSVAWTAQEAVDKFESENLSEVEDQLGHEGIPKTGPVFAKHPLPAAAETDWRPLTLIQGRSPDPATSPYRVSLWDYAGRLVHIRFRYHLEPGQGTVPTGWILEGVKVQGEVLNNGSSVLHSASPGFEEYLVRGGVLSSSIKVGAKVTNFWQGPDVQTPEPTLSSATFKGKASYLLTDPISLSAIPSPALAIRHTGIFETVWAANNGCHLAVSPLIDLEYQVRNQDGTWPKRWESGSRNPEPSRFLLRDPSSPFRNVIPQESTGTCSPPSPSGYHRNTFAHVGTTTFFDLSSLQNQVVRFRLLANDSSPDGEGFNQQQQQAKTTWIIHEMQVSAGRHITDAAVAPASLDVEDNKTLRAALSPQLLQQHGVGEQDAVLSNDLVVLSVPVENQGLVPLRLEVSVSGVNQGSGQVADVKWLQVEGSRRRLTPFTSAELQLDPGESQEVLFQAELLRAPPGRYAFTARVDALDGVDTDPRDDLRTLYAVLLPFRDLEIDVSRSTISPPIASYDAVRTIQTRIINHGNVQEDQVQVAAELVRMTSLTSFEPVGLALDGLEDREVSLARRSDGQATITWILDPSNLETAQEVLLPGKTYAAKITVRPHPESVTKWWDSGPLLEAGQGGLLLNLTTMPLPGCSCLLLPFLVEDVLYATDFSPANSTTKLPQSYPLQTHEQILSGWKAETRLDGAPVNPLENDGLPRWSLANASDAISVFPGQATGKVWLLPKYEGLESLEHILESPELPSHIVRQVSRAVLDLRYASQLEEGQALLQVQTKVGTADWEAIDSLRAKRVAIIVPPDFPQVTASGLPGANSYLTEITGHPAPPFYDDSYEKPYIDGTAATCGKPIDERCWWSSFRPSLFASDNAWLNALNQTLNYFSDELGAANVGLFTDLDGALGFETRSSGLRGYYEFVSNGQVFNFTLRDLSELGLRLDTYGALLLFGDKSTSILSERSPALQKMSHGPGDAVDPQRPLDSPSREYFEEVFELLRASSRMGVRVVGALGPATGTVALSGIAAGSEMATWQTRDLRSSRELQGELRCTLRNGQIPSASAKHPLPGCVEPATNTVNPHDPHNYRYFSPHDAQSRALQDFLRIGGARFTPSLEFCFPTVCTRYPRSEVSQATNGQWILSAGWPEDVVPWAQNIREKLRTYTGELAAGEGLWEHLPPPMAFPVGGQFVRDELGEERFESSPMKFRLVIRSDPLIRGHGAFALDALALLGTNRTRGLGIQVASPQDQASYAPGWPFVPEIAVWNRGVKPTEGTLAKLSAKQVVLGNDLECDVPTLEDITLQVPFLRAGEKRIFRVENFNGGTFPQGLRLLKGGEWDGQTYKDGEPCPPGVHAPLAVAFQATLDGAGMRFDDDDAFDDSHRLLAMGREVVHLTNFDLKILPNEAHYDPASTIELQLSAFNDGNRKLSASIAIALEEARPLPCFRSGTAADGSSQERVHGCDRKDQVATSRLNLLQTISVLPDEEKVVVVPLRIAEVGLGPGVYKVTATLNYAQASGGVTLGPIHRWLHLVPPADSLSKAKALLPPEGGWAADWNDLSSLEALNATPLLDGNALHLPSFWDPSGFQVNGRGTINDVMDEDGARVRHQHDGLYQADPTTRDREQNNRSLRHGWSVIECEALCPSSSKILEWRREAGRSYREGQDPAEVEVPAGEEPEDYFFQRNGMGDFGPDRVIWYPHDASDKKTDPSRTPYLSLASFERPSLSMLTRLRGSANTSYVVEMQLAKRTACTPGSSQGGSSNCEGPGSNNGWSWETPWMSLPTADVHQNAPDIPSSDSYDYVNPVSQPPKTFVRRVSPSNPLGGQLGIWGGESGRSDGDQGWQRLQFSISLGHPDFQSYCNSVAADSLERQPEGMDFCRYAHAMGGPVSGQGGMNTEERSHLVARPVRFRLSAASYGGDAGESFWQIADISLTDHRLKFLGGDSVSLEMDDSSTKVVPLRLMNAGSVNEMVQVTWKPLPGRTGLGVGDTSIAFSLSSKFTDASSTITFPLDSGGSRMVWMRVKTDILEDFPPGTLKAFPFFVVARSLHVPVADASTLIDAQLRIRSWPDLSVENLLLDGSQDQQLSRPVFKPLAPMVHLRNVGDLPMGGPEGPILVRLLARELDPTTGAVRSQQLVDAKNLTQVVEPFRIRNQQVFLNLKEWVPTRQGLFELVAEANLPSGMPDGFVPLRESTFRNNFLSRVVAVGPVKFADLHVTDVWMVPFHSDLERPGSGGCASQRASRIVAGHQYCIVAEVRNMGEDPALDPVVVFGVGTSAIGQRTLEDNTFPPLTTLLFKSSPWMATLRADGSSTWNFYVDVSMRGVSPIVDNKTRKLEVQVDRFALELEDVPERVVLAPGQEIVLTINLTNKGTAAATPRLQIDTDGSALRMHARLPALLLRGEKVPIRIFVHASRFLQEGGKMPQFRLTTAEDPLVNVPLRTQFEVGAVGSVAAEAFPVVSAPGNATVELVLETLQVPRRVTWRIHETSGVIRGNSSWQVSTPPNERRVISLPLQVLPHTAPGVHSAILTLEAGFGEAAAQLLKVPLRLEVLPEPRLRVLLEEPRLALPRGETAHLPFNVTNTGNVPLLVNMSHRLESPPLSSVGDSILVLLAPGENRRVVAQVQDVGSPRSLGITQVLWTVAHSSASDWNSLNPLPWQIEYQRASVRLLKTNLMDLKLKAGAVQGVTALVENPNNQTVNAEVLVAIDGVYHGRATVRLEAHQQQEVVVPFQNGLAGKMQQMFVIARPEGSKAGLDDAAFYEAGDVAMREAAPTREDGLGPFLLWGGLALAMAGVLAVAILAFRRWRGRA